MFPLWGALGPLGQKSGGVLGPFGGHPTLGNGLVSAWKLNEESGTRFDAHGSNHLTDNNTVGFTTVTPPPNFPAGKAASFIATNNESLSLADGFDLGAYYTVSYWANIGAVFGNPAVVSFYDAQPNDGRFVVLFDATTIYLRMGQGGNFQQGSCAGNLDEDGLWHHFVVTFADDTNEGLLYVDNTLRVAISVPNHYASPVPIQVGFGSGLNYFNGGVAHFNVHSRIFTTQERTDLWASGAGLFY